MKAWVKFVLTLAGAALLMLAFRALAFSLYSVSGDVLAPELLKGDRILVNRWSYGLRTGSSDGLFRYGRICRQPVGRGDIVAFDSPVDSLPGVFVCRCHAVPGDTVHAQGGPIIVPGPATCADDEYYWMESLNASDGMDSRTFGPVAGRNIIGRVCMVLYSHDDCKPFYTGYRRGRCMIIK